MPRMPGYQPSIDKVFQYRKKEVETRTCVSDDASEGVCQVVLLGSEMVERHRRDASGVKANDWLHTPDRPIKLLVVEQRVRAITCVINDQHQLERQLFSRLQHNTSTIICTAL